MSYGSQVSVLEAMSDLQGLTRDIFKGRVQNNVRRESPTEMVFQEAGPGDYSFSGQSMKFATDLHFKSSGLATGGQIPDYVPMDAVQGSTTPVRRYDRIAIDNYVELLASGEGSFEDIGDRIFNKLWESWKNMNIRHSIGSSTGVVAKVSSRTSSTVVVLKDGLGHTGTNPIQLFDEGAIIGWYDVSAAGVGGAAAVASIDASTNAVTLDSAATWEPGAATPAADDLIYFASTRSTTADHFTLERNQAPNGAGTILDPNGDNTTVFGIAEADHPRWKPYRKASVTFDHLELAEFWRQLGIKRGFKVTPATDVVVAFPSLVSQLARSLMGYQQQAYTGGTLEGGYEDLKVNGIGIVEDPFFYHDVAATLCKENLFRITLGGDGDFFADDGSMWSRTEDFDAKDGYVREYLNYFSNHRGANGALTGVTTDLTDDDYTTVPSY